MGYITVPKSHVVVKKKIIGKCADATLQWLMIIKSSFWEREIDVDYLLRIREVGRPICPYYNSKLAFFYLMKVYSLHLNQETMKYVSYFLLANIPPYDQWWSSHPISVTIYLCSWRGPPALPNWYDPCPIMLNVISRYTHVHHIPLYIQHTSCFALIILYQFLIWPKFHVMLHLAIWVHGTLYTHSAHHDLHGTYNTRFWSVPGTLPFLPWLGNPLWLP